MVEFKAWDVNEKCWIPQNMISISGDGTMYTKDSEESEEWF